jgi:hypothetical protein
MARGSRYGARCRCGADLGKIGVGLVPSQRRASALITPRSGGSERRPCLTRSHWPGRRERRIATRDRSLSWPRRRPGFRGTVRCAATSCRAGLRSYLGNQSVALDLGRGAAHHVRRAGVHMARGDLQVGRPLEHDDRDSGPLAEAGGQRNRASVALGSRGECGDPQVGPGRRPGVRLVSGSRGQAEPSAGLLSLGRVEQA